MDKKKSLFWDRAKAILKEKKITKKQLSEALDISINTIDTQMKRGISPRLEDASHIADFLGVVAEDLLYDKNSKEDTKRYHKEFHDRALFYQELTGKRDRKTLEEKKAYHDFEPLFNNFKQSVIDIKFDPQMTFDDFLNKYTINDLVVFNELIRKDKQ